MSKKVELILMLQKKQEKNVNITKTFSLHPVILHSIHRRVRRMRHAAVELAILRHNDETNIHNISIHITNNNIYYGTDQHL